MDLDNQEDYRGKGKEKKLCMSQIILMQIKKIMEISSQEMKGGYEEETIISIDGIPQIIKRYVPDGRQAYCNAVLALDIAIVNYLVGADNPKSTLLLEKLNNTKEELNDIYKQYLNDITETGIDQQQLKYTYFSDKKLKCDEIFRQLMIILKRSGFEENED